MNDTAIEILKANLGKLPAKDLGFANSLLGQFAKNGALSSKQWYWVGKLASAAQSSNALSASVDEIQIGEFTGVVDLFIKAKAHLKHPRIWLQLSDGQPVVLSLAGAQAKKPGYVNMTDGKPYGQNVWFGRVSPQGKWELGKKVDEVVADQLVEILERLAAAPERIAAAHGKLTGRCCFCNLQLSDERSTEMGYGPVCAKKWSLPWGKKDGEAVLPGMSIPAF